MLRRFPRKLSRGSFFSDVGGNGRERAVSFLKIILRPHFKKENLRLFGDRDGEKIRQVRESEKWRRLIRNREGGWRAEAAGEGPAEGTGRVGHVLPAWGGQGQN